MRVTGNWLVGMTRYASIVERFPFMKTLAYTYRASFGKSCTSCGSKADNRVFTNETNNVIKILASIPIEDFEIFLDMVKQEELRLTFVNTRGQMETVTRKRGE
jgi:hypothetical protein